MKSLNGQMTIVITRQYNIFWTKIFTNDDENKFHNNFFSSYFKNIKNNLKRNIKAYAPSIVNILEKLIVLFSPRSKA